VIQDDVAYATKISPEGTRRLCEAAGITQSKWEDREFPEPDTREQTRQLTGRDLDELITERDIVSRRPYICASCGRTFTVAEYFRIKGLARRGHRPNPFGSGDEVHESCQ
jgi:hypothetical protein